MGMQQKPVTLQKPYNISIDWDSSRSMNPHRDLVDILVTDASGKEYRGIVTTPYFITATMKKDEQTGECAGGAYFCVPRLVVTRSLDKGLLLKVVGDLVERGDFGDYFISK